MVLGVVRRIKRLLGSFYAFEEENELNILDCKASYDLSLCFFLMLFGEKARKSLREWTRLENIARCTKI